MVLRYGAEIFIVCIPQPDNQEVTKFKRENVADDVLTRRYDSSFSKVKYSMPKRFELFY